MGKVKYFNYRLTYKYKNLLKHYELFFRTREIMNSYIGADKEKKLEVLGAIEIVGIDNEISSLIAEDIKNNYKEEMVFEVAGIRIKAKRNTQEIVVSAESKFDRNLGISSKPFEYLTELLSKMGPTRINFENELVVSLVQKSYDTKTVGYCRVSTKGQLDNNSLEQQREEIRERYRDVIFFEEGYTGKTTDRPIFNELVDGLNIGDTLVVTKLDRLCRSTKEGLEIIEKLKNKGVRIHILNMGLIEDTPMGNLIITNLLAFAEFERAMIVERTQSGRAIAKTKEGYKEGRPKKFTEKQIEHALKLLTINGGDKSFKEVEEITNISKSTLIRANRNKIR